MKTLLHISIFLIIAQLKSFSVEYNILQFKYDENKTLLEFNFQMHNDSLEYKLLNDSSLYSNTKFNIIISSTGIEISIEEDDDELLFGGRDFEDIDGDD